MDERIYSKNIIEFVTVSAEYCAFIERVPELEKEEFLDKIIKILPFIAIASALLVYTIIAKYYLIAVYTAIIIVTFLVFPVINKQNSKKRVIANLRNSFSDWLRNVALNLENKPLIAAIEDTYDDCPYIIKLSLDDFIRDIEANPSDIKPYYEFLSEYKQTDIMSTVRTLYSVSELDYKDRISVLKFMEYIPVFFMALKMSVDMMLIISIYL